MNPKPPIAILHPDLGIGGAERLILDVAHAVNSDYHPVIWTSRYESNRSFQDSRTFHVEVRGNFIPRHIFGFFHIIFSLLRNLWVTICCTLSSPAKIFIVDQISAWLPVIRLFRPDVKIIFYCHYPDLLLAPRGSLLRRLYRLPFDWIEKFGIERAHLILVNSNFTAEKVAAVFKKRKVTVVYPCFSPPSPRTQTQPTVPTFVSLNRYERKKDHGLAICALAQFRQSYGTGRLIIAGGYDLKVSENVAHKEELIALAQSLGIDENVEFRINVSDEDKWTLIADATAVLYTPQNEHFGIVPIEALSLGTPVIACDSGGPCETLGGCDECALCKATPEAFAEAMTNIVTNGGENRAEKLKEHAQTFGFQNFKEKWINILKEFES